MGAKVCQINKDFDKLDQAVDYIKHKFYLDGKFDEEMFEQGEDIIVEGLIQRFEYTHELAWNVIKDFLKERGSIEIYFGDPQGVCSLPCHHKSYHLRIPCKGKLPARVGYRPNGRRGGA